MDCKISGRKGENLYTNAQSNRLKSDGVKIRRIIPITAALKNTNTVV